MLCQVFKDVAIYELTLLTIAISQLSCFLVKLLSFIIAFAVNVDE